MPSFGAHRSEHPLGVRYGFVGYAVAIEYDELVKWIGETQWSLGEQAHAAYAPPVDGICSRIASENVVDYFLDHLLDFTGFDRMLPLFQRVCQFYYTPYPEVAALHIMWYLEWCEEDSDV